MSTCRVLCGGGFSMEQTERQAIIDRFERLDEHDQEAAHSEADDLILEALERAGYKDIADAWREARLRIGFWY